MRRSEPVRATPPAEDSASSTLAKALTSCRPGRFTAPVTSTPMRRTSARDTKVSVLGRAAVTAAVNSARNAAKVSPAAVTGRNSSTRSRPSLSMGNRLLKDFCPRSVTSNSSPVFST